MRWCGCQSPMPEYLEEKVVLVRAMDVGVE